MNKTKYVRHRAGARGLAALAVASLLLAACGDDEGTSADDSSVDATEAGEDALGEGDPASGDPVKIGFVHDGVNPARDTSIDVSVANASVEWINEYRGGVGGRPIELVECASDGDAGKAVDCANELVQEGVSAVAIGGYSQVEELYQPLSDAGIPLVVWSATGRDLLTDTDSVFILANPGAQLADVPIKVATEAGLDKVSVVMIDIPVVTGFYDSAGPAVFEAAGLEFEAIKVAPGTADMTPQVQALADGDRVVHIVGNDGFCIGALNGLVAAGYDGPITSVSQCVTQTTIDSVPGDVLDGMIIQSSFPAADHEDADIQLFEAIVEKYAPGEVDLSDTFGLAVFTAFVGLDVGTDSLTGEVTPASIIAAMKSMPETPLLGAGGVTFRCNGKAVPQAPALCVRGTLIATVDVEGQPSGYEVVNGTSIGD